MLEVSRGIFENPMLLIGSDFRYLAVTDEEYFQKDLGIRLDTETFDAEKMATFLSLHDLSTHVHDPLLLELQGIRTLSVNVFDQEEYLGCLTVFEALPVHKILTARFRSSLQSSCGRLSSRTRRSTRSAVRRALRSVIAGQPVDFELRRALSQENGKTDWVCVRLQPKRGAAPLPGTYLSAALEERYTGAMAFEYERTVAAFLPAAQAECETTAQLLPLLDRLGLVCGVSGVFSNLYEANQAWFQATSALQNGFLQDGNATVFLFSGLSAAAASVRCAVRATLVGLLSERTEKAQSA